MSRQTTNYGLTKPDYTDIADIEVVNANMDIIDGALKVIDTKSNNVMSKNSSAWSSTVAYAVGQYCIYNNSLWKCLVQHSGQTPQEGTYWARVSLDTLGSEINALNSNLENTLKPIYLGSVTTGNITLSEDVTNFKAIFFTYGNADAYFCTMLLPTEMFKPIGQIVLAYSGFSTTIKYVSSSIVKATGSNTLVTGIYGIK